MQSLGGRPNIFPYLLLLPALIITLVIVAWPLVETVRLSFTDAALKPTENFVGFANYEKIFSKKFPEVIGRTFYWMAISVSLKMIVGTMGAMLLNSQVPGRDFFSACWSCRPGSCRLPSACLSGRGCIMVNSA